MTVGLLVAFWLSVFLVLYTYCLYPLLLFVLPRAISSKYDSSSVKHLSSEELPSVGVIISAYNEEQHVRDRVENLLGLNYPEDKLKIYLGLDGCSDDTYSQVSDMKDDRFVLLDFKVNRGKSSVLNDLVGRSKEDILVFSDANTEFLDDNILHLVKHFQDSNVGAVCGELDLIEPETGKNADSMYWKIERFMKCQEGKIGGVLGANGANYAIRRELYTAIPADTIVDDFCIVMNVADSGYRVVYDDTAKAVEETAPDQHGEFNRRVRIGKGNYQAFFRLRGFLRLSKRQYFFTYFSHKVLRWFAPHLMLLAFITNFALALDSEFYFVLFLAHIMLYVVSAIEFYSVIKLPKLIRFPAYIMILNAAFLLAFVKYFSEESSGSWARSDR